MIYFVEIKKSDGFRSGYWANAEQAKKKQAEGFRIFENDAATEAVTEIPTEQAQTASEKTRIQTMRIVR